MSFVFFLYLNIQKACDHFKRLRVHQGTEGRSWLGVRLHIEFYLSFYLGWIEKQSYSSSEKHFRDFSSFAF